MKYLFHIYCKWAYIQNYSISYLWCFELWRPECTILSLSEIQLRHSVKLIACICLLERHPMLSWRHLETWKTISRLYVYNLFKWMITIPIKIVYPISHLNFYDILFHSFSLPAVILELCQPLLWGTSKKVKINIWEKRNYPPLPTHTVALSRFQK